MAPGDTLRGTRVDTVPEVFDGEPGTYALRPSENDQPPTLWALLPSGSPARIPGGDGGWTITEEGDGSVTVAPSIQQHEVPGHAPAWHGFLERGVWREV